MPTIKVILNPVSGRGAGQRMAEAIRHTLTEARATEGLNGIFEASLDTLAWEAGEPAAGALGLIPIGTGNDFAWCMGARIGDVAAACRVLAAGKTRVVDVGHVAQRGPQQPVALPGHRSGLGAQP